MSWSRVRDTELELEAYISMNENENSGCEYHNNSHILAMYQYLEDTDEPYNEALDWAVLFHDIVYDAEPKKEWRSTLQFHIMSEKYRGCNLNLYTMSKVDGLIMSTVNHTEVNLDRLDRTYSAIIRADLHALTSKADTINNFVKIMNESVALYKCSLETFAENNIEFMTGLYERMEDNERLDSKYADFYSSVQDGISTTIRMAQAIKDVKTS